MLLNNYVWLYWKINGGNKMKVIKPTGEIIECTVEEYKQLETKPITGTMRVTVATSAPKTPSSSVVKKVSPTDGRALMWKYIHKHAKPYLERGLGRKKSYSLAMQDYRKLKGI